LSRLLDDSYHKILYERYGKIVKISGVPGNKDMVWIFDPDDIEKVGFTRKFFRLIPQLDICRRALNLLICLGIQK